MKLDTGYLSKLTYTEIELPEIELEIIGTDSEQYCESGVSINGKVLTEFALKQLSEIILIPYKFTKVLRSTGKSHVLSYIQKQLSQISNRSLMTIEYDDLIISIVDSQSVSFKGRDAIKLDQRLRAALADHPRLELRDVLFDAGDIYYSIYLKEPKEILDDTWYWGYTFQLSTTGAIEASIGMEVMKESDKSKLFLPHKTFQHHLDLGLDFEENWLEINDNFLELEISAGWTDLRDMLTKTNVPASYRELKEAKGKLFKLKVDKFDVETGERIKDQLRWDEVVDAYAVKDMNPKPTRVWYTRASTPLKLIDVIDVITKEATHAPNTVSTNLRYCLLVYAGKLLSGEPDLYNIPPQIKWS
jgi:hypothetical protein